MKVLIFFSLMILSSSLTAQEFENCSTGQKEVLKRTQSLLFGKVDRAKISVGKNPVYEKWFGKWTVGREEKVKKNLDLLYSASLLMKPKYICHDFSANNECSNSTIAYVYVNDDVINLCRAFWSLPEYGNDSKSGTILHELSHVNYLSHTEDHCYGANVEANPESCLTLAINNPELAVENADSYQYFIEESY